MGRDQTAAAFTFIMFIVLFRVRFSRGVEPWKIFSADDSENSDDDSPIYEDDSFAGDESAHRRLYDNLIIDYNTGIRPVIDKTESKDVRLHLLLKTLQNLDEANQILQLKFDFLEEWNDFRLSWNPLDYENITHLMMKSCDIWKPTISLMNSVSPEQQLSAKDVFVSHTGTVRMIGSMVSSTVCRVSIKDFPFDSQMCVLTFMPFPFGKDQITLERSGHLFEKNDTTDCGEWNIDRLNYIHYFYLEPFSELKISALNFQIQLTRRVEFHILTIIVPCIFVSIVTLTAFPLSSNSGEKLGLGFSLLLTYSLFLLGLSNHLPSSSSEYAFISIYLTWVMTLTSISIVVCVFIVNIHYQSQNTAYRVPPKVLKICRQINDYLAKIWLSPCNSQLGALDTVGSCDSQKVSALRSRTLSISAWPSDETTKEKEDEDEDDYYSSRTIKLFTESDFSSGLSSEDADETTAKGSSFSNTFPPYKYRRGHTKIRRLEGRNVSNIRMLPPIPSNLKNNFIKKNTGSSSGKNKNTGTTLERNTAAWLRQKDANALLEALVLQHMKEEVEEMRMREWLFLASILDRVFLLVFLFLFVVVSIHYLLVPVVTHYLYRWEKQSC